MSLLSRRTLTKKLLTSRAFRKRYVWEHLKRSLPFQMRTLRDERGWSQERTAQELNKTQSMISRLESPAYGRMSLQTLVEIAEGFDVGILIKFVPFSRLVKEYEDVSSSALSAQSVTEKEEADKLQAWAAEELLTRAPQLWALPKPVSTSGTQHTLVFSSPKLVTDTENSTSDQPAFRPKTQAAVA